MISTYSIKDLERLTNVKAHTLRTWEKRYNIVCPQRTESNIRYYTEEDVKKLLNIAILNRYGMRISTIANLSLQALNQKVIEVIRPESDYQSQIESLVVAMIELNEERFEKILSQSIIKIGFEESLYHIIYPFFEKTGMLWQTGTVNPAQEHFISNLIRMKLFVAIDSLPNVVEPHAKKIILFLPEWELHEIGMLTHFYLARKHSLKVFYLGQNMPLQDLFFVGQAVEPHYLATSFVSAVQKKKLKEYIQVIMDFFPKQKLFISGIQSANIDFELPENACIVASAKKFIELIST